MPDLRVRHAALLLPVLWLATVGTAAGQISVSDEHPVGPERSLPAFIYSALSPILRPISVDEAPYHRSWRPGLPQERSFGAVRNLIFSGQPAERAVPGIELNAWSGPAIGSTGFQAGVIMKLRF